MDKTLAPDPPEWETLLREFEGALAFDIGAHVGYTARLLAEKFDRVVAVEPAVESFLLLNQGAPDNVVPMNMAVGRQAGIEWLAVRTDKITDGQLVTADWPEWGDLIEHRSVQSTTLDAMVVLHGSPSLVKVDTEGAEVAVLAGGVSTLRQYRPDLYVEVHTEGNAVFLEQMLRPLYPDLVLHRHPHYGQQSWHWRNHLLLTARM